MRSFISILFFLHVYANGEGAGLEILQSRKPCVGKYSNYKVIQFKTKSGKIGRWEILNTIRHPSPDNVNGVSAIVRVRNATGTYFLFNKQFRVPTQSWTIEFPAGVVDTNETAKEAALRELREETGYHAANVTFESKGRQPTFSSRTDDLQKHVLIDCQSTDLKQASPEDEELTYPLFIKESDLWHEIRRLETKYDIASNVYTFAMGIAIRDGLI
ncbi:hypothetical protein WR25_19578 [Diploscapter pachys]|uniref:Nudix hydrolase domain-containing protein n=1 Tax=Diploscapter pachys TaxID=2018661 RepID=A0A2A2LCP8_9BILA|nr:hypothetical protein WR25_19578 [Diploscapter pachys]